MINRFSAAVIQSNVHVFEGADPDAKERVVRANIERAAELIDYTQLDPRSGKPRLVSFPEFFLSGVPEHKNYENYFARTITVPGPETEALGRKAREYGLYISGANLERDDSWPGHYFNTGFIIGPDGNVILRYRKNNDNQSGFYRNTNTPDIYDQYIARHGGPEALFPVVETEIGRLACYTDVGYAEEGRMYALQGAEVLIQATAEGAGDPNRNVYDAAKMVRAWENQCYLLSVNQGETIGGIRPRMRQGGRSKLISYEGQVMAETDVPGETVVSAIIDLEAQRRYRTSGFNYVVYSRFKTYLPLYEKYNVWNLNNYADGPNTDRERAFQIRQQAFERAFENGTLRRTDVPQQTR
jgi:predicted amidohydrolase